jgi:hypothetical protein
MKTTTTDKPFFSLKWKAGLFLVAMAGEKQTKLAGYDFTNPINRSQEKHLIFTHCTNLFFVRQSA